MNKGKVLGYCFLGICIAVCLLVLIITLVKNVLLALVVILLIICMILSFYIIKEFKKKNEMKLYFLSIVHDLKTPLYSIMNLTKDFEYNKNENVVNNIQYSSNNLLRIINNLLAMNKLKFANNHRKDQSFNIGDIITEVSQIISIQAKAKNISFNIYNDYIRDEDVIGDKFSLIQIIINLLSNSIKYTKNNGSVKLTLNQYKKQDKNYFSFTIDDSGIGMSDEFINTLFKPFTRDDNHYVKQNNGSGMGMYIVKKMVEQFNGKIYVYSQEGVGSRFVVKIPLKIDSERNYEEYRNKRVIYFDTDVLDYHYNYRVLKRIFQEVTYYKDIKNLEAIEENYDYLFNNTMYQLNNINNRVGRIINIKGYLFKKTVIDSIRDELPKTFDGKRILLADDNVINLEITSEIIKEKGIIVDTVADGKALYDKFIESEVNYYDMIMTDIHMPIIDGYEVSKKIRNLKRKDATNIPIIAVSACSYSDEKKNIDDSMMTDFIDKPINMNNLLCLLRKYFVGNK